jgi:transcriptional regulator with XRE-family HTH domain
MEHARQRRSAIHTREYQFLLKQLRQARSEAGLTQVQVAKALGHRQSYVTKCELGERRLDPIDLLRFARLYKKPVAYFLPKM